LCIGFCLRNSRAVSLLKNVFLLLERRKVSYGTGPDKVDLNPIIIAVGAGACSGVLQWALGPGESTRGQVALRIFALPSENLAIKGP
jgi:hypothetical protein